ALALGDTHRVYRHGQVRVGRQGSVQGVIDDAGRTNRGLGGAVLLVGDGHGQAVVAGLGVGVPTQDVEHQVSPRPGDVHDGAGVVGVEVVELVVRRQVVRAVDRDVVVHGAVAPVHVRGEIVLGVEQAAGERPHVAAQRYPGVPVQRAGVDDQ